MKDNKNFESELPKGHEPALYINATETKLGLIFTIVSLVVLAVVLFIAIIPIVINDRGLELWESLFDRVSLYSLVTIMSMIIYVTLHELTHGIFYKIFTGQKLTFGMSWSCFYCGVPEIFVYRRAAMVSAAAPLVIFTVILLPLTFFLYFVNLALYLISAFLLGIHLGGCCGDAYVISLLLFRFRDDKTLVRDTGPEQFFFVPTMNS